MRLTLLLATLALPSLAFAQGALAPSAAPAPTMKTLDQIEARTPLQAGAPGVRSDTVGDGLVINAPGSYYLTGNLTVSSGSAINVAVSNVTVDLNGFALSSASDTGCGVEISSALFNVTIRNGHIGDGFAWGIKCGNNTAGVVIEDVSVNGVSTTGLQLSNLSVARRCTVADVGGTGISARDVYDSRANECGNDGISCLGLAQNCIAQATDGYGVTAQAALNCSGTSVSSAGISTTGTATNCTGKSGLATGLSTRVATNCTGESTSGTGLSALTATGCFGMSTTGIGLRAQYSATGCLGTTNSGAFGLQAGSSGTGGTAENCRGLVNAAAATGTGLTAETTANCFGQATSGTGLIANTANNCSAYTALGAIAMDVAGSATNCRGNNGSGGTAIRAAIAVSCTTAGGAIDTPANKKFLGTP